MPTNRRVLARVILIPTLLILCLTTAFARTASATGQLRNLLNSAIQSFASGTKTTMCATTNGNPYLHLSPASVSGLTAAVTGVVILPPGDTLTGIDWSWGDGTIATGCIYCPQSIVLML